MLPHPNDSQIYLPNDSYVFSTQYGKKWNESENEYVITKSFKDSVFIATNTRISSEK